MSIRIKDRDIGVLDVTPKGDSVEMKIRGLMGTAEVFEALRGIPNDPDLRHFSDRVGRVIKAAKEGCQDVDSYLERGGIVVRTGGLWLYKEFVEGDAKDPDLTRWGYKRVKAVSYFPKSKLEGGGPLAGSAKGEYFVAAPRLAEKLSVGKAPQYVGRLFTDHKILLSNDRVEGGFVDGVSEGFRERFRSISQRLGADLIIAGSKIAVSRIYDHARGQVPGLEEL